MSNSNVPQGLIPHGKIYRARSYVAGGTVYVGDAVALDSAGKVVAASAGATPLLGSALSYATTGQTISVADSPHQLYRIKASSTEIGAQTDINMNYNIVATGGSTTYKISRMALDSSSDGLSDTNMPVKLLGIDPRPDNALGAYVDCVVVINNHFLKGDTGTLGV